jgi:hypothetical protein
LFQTFVATLLPKLPLLLFSITLFYTVLNTLRAREPYLVSDFHCTKKNIALLLTGGVNSVPCPVHQTGYILHSLFLYFDMSPHYSLNQDASGIEIEMEAEDEDRDCVRWVDKIMEWRSYIHFVSHFLTLLTTNNLRHVAHSSLTLGNLR